MNVYLENEKIVQVSCGCCHSLASTETDFVYGWDWNNMLQVCGQKHTIQLISILLDKFNGEKVLNICCGFWHSN